MDVFDPINFVSGKEGERIFSVEIAETKQIYAKYSYDGLVYDT